MFDNIFVFPHSTSQLTVVIVDGAHVRYVVSFYAPDDGLSSTVTCAVVHAGSSNAVELSVTDHR